MTNTVVPAAQSDFAGCAARLLLVRADGRSALFARVPAPMPASCSAARSGGPEPDILQMRARGDGRSMSFELEGVSRNSLRVKQTAAAAC